PLAVQPMLLRALETGEIQPVGARRARRVDVRIITATDADLEAAAADGRFRVPLLHRLRGFEVRLPALRDRLDDVPRLLLHFLRAELATLGSAQRLAPAGQAPLWLPASVVLALLRHDWPGNVRELRNIARQIAVAGFDQAVAPPLALPTPSPPPPRPEVPRPETGPPLDLVDRLVTPRGSYPPEDVARALEACRYSVRQAADRLGVPKSNLLRYAQRALGLRTAAEIPDDEWRACQAAFGDDVDAIAALLRVSPRAVRSRLKDLEPR
ncbi:MAG: sigma 54-interacting transcriptional regulator, partial [Myxococcales bacterium]|nr:sigma 54-interacting transcriptional regulator [Myxococcales bacterium]